MFSEYIHTKRLNICDESILERIELQKYLSKELMIFPKFKFEILRNSVVQYSSRILKKSLPSNTDLISKLWLNFLTEIEYMHSYNYVHGDILMKNIIYDGVRLKLIDHELSLYHKGQLRATYPWVDVADFKKKTVTKSTDKICLKATELRLFNFNEYKEFRKSQELLITFLMRLHK